MSAAEHEARIKRLGEQLEQHHAVYEAAGCFDALARADGYRVQMERAIKQRSPDAVAAMEAERGLA